jgi:hypothetical protein
MIMMMMGKTKKMKKINKIDKNEIEKTKEQIDQFYLLSTSLNNRV